MTPSSLLLIEEAASVRNAHETVLRTAGHTVQPAATAETALRLFRQHRPAAVVLDLSLSDRDGIDLMREFHEIAPATPVIVIAAEGSLSRAVAAMRAGAHEFLVRPFDDERLLQAVGNALDRPMDRPLTTFDSDHPAGLTVSCPSMHEVYARIRSVARSMATVFITGESGTGKEFCAQAVHDLSHRADGPFVPLNCAAIPAESSDAELFGHLKDASAGASGDGRGAVAAADGGTLFLDGICDLGLGLQDRLLRFLQTSTILPVGATRPRRVDVRVVCACDRDPAEAVRAGVLREDLFHRLHVVPIHIPPLRDRGDDILSLALSALRRFSQEEGRRFTALGEDAKALLRRYDWPGNVRQLLNVIRNIVALNDGRTVTRAMLPADIVRQAATRPDKAAADNDMSCLDRLLQFPLCEIERRVIERSLYLNGNSVPRAARALGVAPSTLYRKIEAWNAGKT